MVNLGYDFLILRGSPSPTRARDVGGRQPLRSLFCLLLCTVLTACQAPAPPPERAPQRDFENLVVLMLDTLRSDHLPSYGYSRNTAPFLGELAAEGIQLQGYAVSSWTRSSVATLLTGLYPQRHQTIDRHDKLPRGVPYLPVMLAPYGFHTSAFIANGNVSSQFGFERGFSVFEERLEFGKVEGSHLVDEILEQAGELRRPFCLYLHFIDPHDPYVPQTAWERPDAAKDLYVQPAEILSGERQLDDEAISWLIDQYDAEIREMDDALRVLMDGLEAAGVLDDTLVVVTSDHGEEFGERGSVAHGQSLHEEVIQVPYVLWGGSKLSAYRSDAPFHQVDFVPTVLSALGVPVPPDLDGTSQWAQIRDRSYTGRQEQLYHLELDYYESMAIRQDSRKLMYRVQEPRKLTYDLAASPDERAVSEFAPEELAPMEERLRKLDRELEKRSYERETAEASGEVRKQLQALGYLGESPAALPENRAALEATVLDRTLDAADVVARTIDLRGPSRQLLQGWVFRDGNGTWSAPRARFALPADQEAAKIVLAGHSLRARETVICEVEVNGRAGRQHRIAPGDFELEVTLSDADRSAGVVYLDLTIQPPLSVPGIPQPVGLHWNRFEVVGR